MRFMLVITLMGFILIAGCINQSRQPLSEINGSNISYNLEIKKLPSYLLRDIPQNKIISYEYNNTKYFVYKINGNDMQSDDYNITFKNGCVNVLFSSETTTKTTTDYDILIVITTNATCVNINGIEEISDNAMECYSDNDCIHYPAPCHQRSQQCIPYYTANAEIYDMMKSWKNMIVCTMECRPCLSCKCRDGKCISEKVRGCC